MDQHAGENSLDETTLMVLQEIERFLQNWDGMAYDRQGFMPAEKLQALIDLGAFSFLLPEQWEGLGGGLSELEALVEMVSRYHPALAILLLDHATALMLITETSLMDLNHSKILSAGLLSDGKHLPDYGSGVVVIKNKETETPEISLVSPAELEIEAITPLGLGALNLRRCCQQIGTEKPKAEITKERISGARAIFRAGLARIAATIAHKAYKSASEYAAARIQFKRPLDANQMIRNKLVGMRVALWKMKVFTYRNTAAFSEEEYWGPGENALYYCADRACNITLQAMQIQGGNGFMEETGIPAQVRNATGIRLLALPLINPIIQNGWCSLENDHSPSWMGELIKTWQKDAIGEWMSHLEESGSKDLEYARVMQKLAFDADI